MRRGRGEIARKGREERGDGLFVDVRKMRGAEGGGGQGGDDGKRRNDWKREHVKSNPLHHYLVN